MTTVAEKRQIRREQKEKYKKDLAHFVKKYEWIDDYMKCEKKECKKEYKQAQALYNQRVADRPKLPSSKITEAVVEKWTGATTDYDEETHRRQEHIELQACKLKKCRSNVMKSIKVCLSSLEAACTRNIDKTDKKKCTKAKTLKNALKTPSKLTANDIRDC